MNVSIFTSLGEFFSVISSHWSDWYPEMSRAILVTLEITAGAFLLAVVIGLIVAVGRLSRHAAVRHIAHAYVEITRGVPCLVILFLIYFGLVPLGIVVEPVQAGIVGLGLSVGGYVAEIFRAGIEATHKGQREAGLTVGMSPLQIYLYVIIPQATRITLPALFNMLIVTLKDSSLASLVSVPEIMLRAKDIASSEFLPLHILVLAGCIYLVLAVPLSLFSKYLERRMATGLRGRA